LSQSSIQQTSALQQTASSLEEIKSMVAKTSDNAIETSSFSGQSIKVASRGEGVVNEMISAMEKINQSNKTILDEVNKGNKNLNDVSNLIREIENKTKIINDIVFQTKLLSFNASVEAARAGENGKGFSVVAEEIGNLATLSGTAAKEITQILTDSVSKVDHIVKVTEANVSGLVTSGNENVEYGVKVAQSCGEVLKEIVTNVESSAQMAQEISSASLEQSQGITEISAAINELDAAVHLNTNTSSEVAQAANDLMKQAENLNSLILELNLTVKGS
jgi:methyl-accepting chemotaxis protein